VSPKAIPKLLLHKYVAMFFMLDLCPNKVGKGEDHCYLYVAYCCSWEQVGEHHQNHLKPKGFPLFISFFIFKL